MSLGKSDLVVFHGYEVDRLCWQLRWQDETIPLNRKTFDLLLYLVDHRERVVNKDELLRTLWPDQFVEESNLTQHIFLLRKALSRHDGGSRMIETIPGRGYRFTAPLEEAPGNAERMTIGMTQSITRIKIEEEEIEPQPADVPLSVDRSPGKREGYLRPIVGFVVLVALLLGGWFARERWLDQTSGSPVNVVLTTMEGTTGDPVLDRGLAEALRIDLAQSPFVSPLSAGTVRATLTQMMHKPDDAVTVEMAREICERTNSQAVIHGSIARAGQHFLLTEEASNCVDGKILAATKQEAETADGLPHSIDKLAASLRQKLGESRRSIARFNTPLFADTASLDALKAYTQATDANRRGETAQSIALFKTAIAADPKFATAYYALAISFRNTGDTAAARSALAQAYALRDTTSKPLQFAITEAFNDSNTQDMYEGLRNLQNWTELYPNSYLAWNGLSNLYSDFGQYPEALAASQRALNLMPQSQVLRQCLATTMLESRDLKAAQAMLDKAIADGLDGELIRTRYLELAYLLHDDTMLAAQRKWAESHPEIAGVVLAEVRIAIAEGRFSDAGRFIAQLRERKRQQGVEGAGDKFAKAEAVELMQAGDIEDGKRIFASIPIDIEEGQEVVGLSYEGNFTAAQSAIQTMQTKYPNGTLWHLYWVPQVQAVIDMANGKPGDAAAILETSRPVERRELVIPWLRGTAYLAAGQANLAETDFRSVVNHPEIDPTSPAISLSWLGLGRALAAENKIGDARGAYQHFLTLWAHADPDAFCLKQAKQEYAVLRSKAHV